MTTQECQELIRAAIKRGLVKAASVKDPTETIKRSWSYHRTYERNQRQMWLSQGLTTEGKIRKRNYQYLTGMTPEQKHERQLEQQRQWNLKQKNRL